MPEPKIVTGYRASVASRHVTKAMDELDIHLAVRTVGSGQETVYVLRPAQVVDLISQLAGQVGLVLVEKRYE